MEDAPIRMEDARIKIVHWYDTQTHRLACGAPGQMNSTKYARFVTCAACLGIVLKVGRGEEGDHPSQLL